MKKIIVSLIIIFYALIIPLPAQSSTADISNTAWYFNARIFDGAIGSNTAFDDGTLLFNEQIPKSDGDAFLDGQIFWKVKDTVIAVTNFFGELQTTNDFLLIGDTGGLLTAFRGVLAENGKLVVGELSGFAGSNLRGFFWATPVDLPPSGMLMLFALGSLFIIGGIKVHERK